MSHILAIHSYGTHRVKDPQTGQMISAYKIGYTSAAADLLLALYDTQARDVSSSRASYRYIQIIGATRVRYGYLLLKLTDTELAQAEAVAKLHHRAGAYLYRDKQWQELPSQSKAEYSVPTARMGPNFSPAGLRPVELQSDEEAEVAEGIYAERSQRSPADKVWWWLTGDTYPHRELLKRQRCRWSKGRRSWYFIGETLPDAVKLLVTDWGDESVQSDAHDTPCSDEEAEQILGVKLLPKPNTPDESPQEIPQTELPAEESPPPIRIIKPISLPAEGETADVVQTAIQAAKQKLPVNTSHTTQPSNKLTPISQAYVGELTGSITGNVYCYGYATYNDLLLYLNAAGPRMAVEAIRARLAKGEIINLVPWDAPAIELSAGETDGKANTGMFTTYLQNIPEAKFTSAILVHEWLTEPNYKGKSVTGIFRTSEEQAMAKLLDHVRQLVNIPIFDAWSAYLYTAGQTASLVRRARSGGEIDLLVVELELDSWTRLVTGGLAQGVIQLPVNTGVNE